MGRLNARVARMERRLPPRETGLSFRTRILIQRLAAAQMRAEPGLLDVQPQDTDPATYARIQIIRAEARGHLDLPEVRSAWARDHSLPSDRSSVIDRLQRVIPARSAEEVRLNRLAVLAAQRRASGGIAAREHSPCP